MSSFDTARRHWDIEVDSVAAELVEQGVPPWDAAEQARRIVSQRRRMKRKPMDLDDFAKRIEGDTR